MIFQLYSDYNDEYFSWRLSKNPESEPFFREFGNNRFVHGKYIYDNFAYLVIIENDELTAIKRAKEENRFSYLNNRIYDVNPDNLQGVKEVFRSLLNAKFSGIPEEEIHKAYEYKISVGPFDYDGSWVEQFCSKLNIELYIHSYYDNIYEYCFYANLPLYEFIQKVYVLLYAVSNELVLDENKLESFNYSWIQELNEEDKTFLVSKLLKASTKYVKNLNNAAIFGVENTDEESEVKETYHEKRLTWVREQIKELSCNSIIDLGCGTGQLYKNMVNLDKYNIIGIEIDKHKVNKARKRYKFVRHGNILNLNLKESELKPDIVTLIEVIEHFEEHDRRTLLYNIRDIIQPTNIIITTPNIEYNKYFTALNGELRHKDHKIEYTYEKFYDEVYKYFEEKYTGNIESVNDENGEPVSWILLLKRKNNQEYLNLKLRKNYDSFRLTASNYFISENQIYSGMCDPVYIKNISNIFYLGPTISPVDYNPNDGNILENINSAVNYYVNKNIFDISIEEKQMGSRGYILAFRTQEMAESLGYSNKIIINSRGGYKFFDNEEILTDIHNDLFREDNLLTTDVMMFDAEITPWALKAENLILKEFSTPLNKILYHESFTNNTVKYNNANKASKLLSNYSDINENIKVHIFQTLFTANMHEKGGFKDVIIHPYYSSYDAFEDNILDGKYIRKINRYNLHVTSYDKSFDKILELVYNSFIEKKLEGAVVKPLPKFNIRDNGKLIQPALKVRNPEYLRLIYGTNYMEPNMFPMIANRNTSLKRKQAVVEFELSLNMLRAFASRDRTLLNQYIASFLAIQDGIFGVDATL